MNKNDVLAPIYADVSDILKDSGFRLKKRDQSFERKFDGGFQHIGVVLTDYRPTYIVQFVIVLRYDAIQEIILPYFGTMLRDPSQSFSCVVELNYLHPGAGVKFEIESLADWQRHLETLRPVFEQKMLPFLDEFLSLEKMERRMNTEDDLVKGGAINAAYVGIAAACLTQPAHFEDIVARHLIKVRAFGYAARVTEPLEKMIDMLRAKLANAGHSANANRS